jgi:2-polyprenyl-3-methyl-5-hydroxy-6-metoxy-1,4-benzoquinol methylase
MRRRSGTGVISATNSVLSRNIVSGVISAQPAERLDRVLDVGAGQGTQSIRLARQGHEVLAIEPDAEMRAAGQDALPAEPDAVRTRVNPHRQLAQRAHLMWRRPAEPKRA